MSFYATTSYPATTYGPFGNIESQTGVLAEDNVYRFSTKYFDTETQLFYYGLRYYDPELGRWINRDPIEEDGGLNLYGFVENNCLYWLDYLGEAILRLAVYLDSSTSAELTPPTMTMNRSDARVISEQLQGVTDVIEKCESRAFRFDVELRWSIPSVEELVDPPNERTYLFFFTEEYYDNTTSGPSDLLDSLPSGAFGGLKIMFTNSGIWSSSGGYVRGTHYTDSGIVIAMNSCGKYTLAHEIGHAIQWRSNSGDNHSTDSENLMHSPSPDSNPKVDCTYCILLNSYVSN